MTTASSTHIANLSFGHLHIRQISEPQVQITTMDSHGTRTEVVPFRQVFHGADPGTVFSAYWWGPGWAKVDVNCGAQRWRGEQSLRAVRTALYQCDFTPEQATTLLREMRKQAA